MNKAIQKKSIDVVRESYEKFIEEQVQKMMNETEPPATNSIAMDYTHHSQYIVEPDILPEHKKYKINQEQAAIDFSNRSKNIKMVGFEIKCNGEELREHILNILKAEEGEKVIGVLMMHGYHQVNITEPIRFHMLKKAKKKKWRLYIVISDDIKTIKDYDEIKEELNEDITKQINSFVNTIYGMQTDFKTLSAKEIDVGHDSIIVRKKLTDFYGKEVESRERKKQLTFVDMNTLKCRGVIIPYTGYLIIDHDTEKLLASINVNKHPNISADGERFCTGSSYSIAELKGSTRLAYANMNSPLTRLMEDDVSSIIGFTHYITQNLEHIKLQEPKKGGNMDLSSIEFKYSNVAKHVSLSEFGQHLQEVHDFFHGNN